MLDENCDWLRIGLRIVDRQLHIHVAEVSASKALCEAQSFASRMPQCVQRCFVVEPDGFHDEIISRPLADGITEPAGLRVRRKCAAIAEDLAEHGLRLVQDHREPGCLDDFKWSRYKALKRESGQGAKRRGPCWTRRSLAELRTHLRPHRFLTGGIVGKDVEEILRREILAESVNAAGQEELLYLLNGRAFSLPDSG